MKQKYYSIAKIKSLNCEYNIILGERSNGKSFATKHNSLHDAYEDKTDQSKFIYLRRWDLEIKPSMIEQYFVDANVELMTSGTSDCVIVHNKGVYLAKRDENGKPVKQRLVGYAMALTMAEHYKSGIYTDVKNIIYEEFISGNTYLAKEPQKLQQYVSTIARRERIQVWLIGNTISRICPYFTEWDLRNVPKQKQGTIDIYEHTTDQFDENNDPIKIRIAVEYAENSGNNGKMFFGSSGKMINSGAWQSEEKPHLPEKMNAYLNMYEIVVEWVGFKFRCIFMTEKKSGAALWYVEPKTTPIKQGVRLVTDRVVIDTLTTRGFAPLNKNEVVAFSYLKQGVIFYSDNLTGGDFETCMKQLLTISY